MNASAVVAAIPFSDWQVALGAPGVVLGGIEELDQSIRIILGTPKGSDVHRPDFGTDLHVYIDWPQNTVRPYLVRETWAALQRWEPRIKLLKTVISFDMENVLIDIEWRPADDSTQIQNTRVSLPGSTT